MKLTYQGVVYSKKNSKSIITNRRTGKPMIVASKKAKDMEKVEKKVVEMIAGRAVDSCMKSSAFREKE